jgi:hypothetical protein
MLGGPSSYAVSWVRPGERLAIGKVLWEGEVLEFSGSVDGHRVGEVVAVLEIASVRIERAGALRIRGQPTVVLELSDGLPLLVLPLGPGVLHELVKLIGDQLTKHNDREIALVLPLKADAIPAAKLLIGSGPPFDPSTTQLERHSVFLSSTEAIIVFVGDDAAELVRRILLDPADWATLAGWSPLLDGPPRLALATYRWSAPNT